MQQDHNACQVFPDDGRGRSDLRGFFVLLVIVAIGVAAIVRGESRSCERTLPPELDLSESGVSLVASTRDGWAVLTGDSFRRSVDGEWQDPVPLVVDGPAYLDDPEAFVIRQEFIAVPGGFAFVDLHRHSHPDRNDSIGSAHRYVSKDGITWTLDISREVDDPLRIENHTDDGFSIVRRVERSGGGTSFVTEMHTIGAAFLTVVDTVDTPLGPAFRRDGGTIVSAEQLLPPTVATLDECSAEIGAGRGTVSSINIWNGVIGRPLVVPFPCEWQIESGWIGEGALTTDRGRILVASTLGLWTVTKDGDTESLVTWTDDRTGPATFVFTPNADHLVRMSTEPSTGGRHGGGLRHRRR